MDTKPAGNQAPLSTAPRKTWKDYTGWAAFVVTAGILIEQTYTHGSWMGWFLFSSGKSLAPIFDSQAHSILYRVSYAYEIASAAFFTLFPLAVLVLLFLRKKAVPGLLILFAAAALFSNITAEVLYNALAVEMGGTVVVELQSVLYAVIDVALIAYYAMSKRFRALFIR